MTVDNIKLQTVCQYTGYCLVVADFFNQVVRITTGEADATQIVRTDTTVVIADTIAEMVIFLGAHLAFHPLFYVVVIDIFPNNRHTVCTDDTQERLVFIAPWFRDDERDFHIFLLTHAAS